MLSGSCFPALTATGTLSGNSLSLTLSDGVRPRVAASATVSGNSISGTYGTLDLTGTQCAPDNGVFNASRQ